MSPLLRPLVISCLFASAVSNAAPFTLSSPTIKANGFLPEAQVANNYGCTGQNLSPALEWTNAPKSVKSYAITVYDPDAPTGSGWWHWIVYNLPSQTTHLDVGAGTENSTSFPAATIQGRTDGGNHSFGGACPPKGDKPHRYIFTIHALSTEKIDLPPEASAALVGFMIHNNQIAKASFIAKYGRK